MKPLLLLLICALAGAAQSSTSAIFGTVTDQKGAPVSAASIVARHEATGFLRTATSTDAGSYRIEQLPPGVYSVSASRDGFRTALISGASIDVDRPASLGFQLKIGEVRETVEVKASLSRLQTDESSVGYIFDDDAVLRLPLDERNVISLVTLGPGAVPRELGGFVHDVDNDIQQGTRGSVALNPPVNGSRPSMNRYLMDGADNTDRNAFAMVVTPPMEAVQEFVIQSSLASAGFAQSAGAVVDMVTKSGAHDFHGNAFEYFRNESTDARNYFDVPGLPRPVYRRNQAGASLGGRLPARATFFYGAYEAMRAKSASPSVQLVPDGAARSGNFAGAAIYDPLSGATAASRSPFPNGAIPKYRIDPIASQYLTQYEPLPNRPTDGGNNYMDATPNPANRDAVSFRVDRQFREGRTLFARYSLNSDRNGLGGAFPLRPTSDRARAQQFALGYALAGAGWTNEIRASFTRLRLFDVTLAQSNIATALGIADAPSDAFSYGLPYFRLTNYSTLTDDPSLPQVQRDNTWTGSESFSRAKGNNTFRAGFSVTKFQLNYRQSSNARGLYVYDGGYTGNGVDPASGDALADFLLGYPLMTQRSSGDSQAYLRQGDYSAFAEQAWRVHSRLTLSAGVRYEYSSPFTEARDGLLNLDYSRLPAAPRLVSVARAYEPNRLNFSPRVGLAWRIPGALSSRGEAVFRAGYGIYFSPEMAIESYDLALNNTHNEMNYADSSSSPVLTTRNGFPVTASSGFPSYFGLDSRLPEPYVQQWNAGFQREMPGGVVVEAVYVGSKGVHLGRFRRFNTALHTETGENLAPRAGDLQSLRTFPSLGVLIQRQHIANSSYNSLQLKAEKRFRGSLAFSASFVWAKSIDDATSVVSGMFDSAGAQDEHNLKLERGLSFFNVGRKLSGYVVYRLPSPQLLTAVTGGWQFSGTFTFQDGTPLDPMYAVTDLANAGTFTRPDVVPGQSVSLPASQRSPEHWFNTGAFRAPAPYHFGNAGRNIIPGPGNMMVNFALHKSFSLGAHSALQLRVETFNALNSPNLGIPMPYPDLGPFFGRLITAGQPRRFQFATRLEF